MSSDRAPGTPPATCADASAAAGEALPGTSTQATDWLVVEQRGLWGRDAVADTELPGGIREVLGSFSGSVLLARRPERRGPETFVFRATSHEAGGTLTRHALPELAAPDPTAGGEPEPGPLLLVCSHGRRDACCARLGVPVFEALGPHVDPGLLWQSSHQGGHRFAANVLALPAGVQLGRVTPEIAPKVARLLRDHRIPLDAYRGRAMYAARVQAAEVEIRRRHGLDRVGALTLLGDDGERVSFAHPAGESTVAVEEHPGPMLALSCGGEPEATVAYSVRW